MALREIIMSLYPDRPPTPAMVWHIFSAALDQRPDNPEAYPKPDDGDWAWLDGYATATGETWVAELF